MTVRNTIDRPVQKFREFSLKEPIVILVSALITLQAVVEATLQDGFTWQTLVISGVTALLGVFMRQSVYSPKRHQDDMTEALDTVEQAIDVINSNPIEFTHHYDAGEMGTWTDSDPDDAA